MRNKNNLFWLLSLVVMILVNAVYIVVSVVRIELSDSVIRIMGLLNLLSLPILVYTSIQKVKTVIEKRRLNG